jgi:Ran GTPase-activating protein (RanGAP) involved in mRNA processing and transport
MPFSSSRTLCAQLVYITVEAQQSTGSWSSIESMEALAEHLLAPSPLRSQGTHEAQGVLVRAGPGTGKTVSLQQLTRIIAKRLLAAVPAPMPETAPGGRRGSSSSSSVDPATGGPGVGLVPMLLSVQRLASYMKQRGGIGGGGDLLRAYIDTEYSGPERDLLAQAYQLRALVVSIDGVDEAASLKTRIEDLVVGQLAPMGVRTVVSSRPEGVRLERYADWNVMNLSPLSDEQQHIAIQAQLKNSTTFESLQSLSKARRQGGTTAQVAICEALAVSEGVSTHYDAITAHVKSSVGETDVDGILERILNLFDEATKVPVMLSMYVLCLAALKPTTALSTTRLELYKNSVRGALRRKFPDDVETGFMAGRMLAKMAVANHLAQRREFTSLDVQQVLADEPDELALWQRLDAEGGTDAEGVPLIKTLEIGEAGSSASAEHASKYQFAHLSFQESFFAEALCAPVQEKENERASQAGEGLLVSGELAASVQVVWSRGSLKLLNDRWLLNTFTICGGVLGSIVGEHLGSNLTDLRLTEHQVKTFIALEWEALRGRTKLARIVLSCGKGADMIDEKSPGVVKLAAILADSSELPALTSLDFGNPVRIGVAAAAHIAAACSQRKGLRLTAPVHAAEFSSLSDADAVLITATLRNVASVSSSALESFAAVADVSACGGGFRITSKSDPTICLADVLKEAGTQASAYTKDLASAALLAGYSVNELRSGMRLSTAELGDAGCSAVSICASMGSGPPTAATLRELADNMLALELVATASTSEYEDLKALTIEDLRNAECKGVPGDSELERVLQSAELEDAKTVGTKALIDASAKDLSDTNAAVLMWAIALYCSKDLNEISLSKNRCGPLAASVVGQFLRFNRTVSKLDLHENAVGDEGAKLIAKALAVNSTLATLRLSVNNLTKAGAEMVFEGVASNYALQSLTLETSAGTMSPGIDIRPLKGLVPADQINLSSRNFGLLSALVVAKLVKAYKPQLVEFAIDRNALKYEGAAEVAEMLKTNDDIRTLDVRFCALGPEGIKVLCEALKVNTSVEKVLALANNLGEHGAKAVEDLLRTKPDPETLRHFDLQDNLFPSENKKALRDLASKRAPNLRLVIDAVDSF